MVCERWCVKDGGWQRWCVKDGGDKDGVWQSCLLKTVCERWWVTRMVCSRWWWQSWCVEDVVWQSCVLKMVCERWWVTKMVCKLVCERWCVAKFVSDKDNVTKLYVTKLCVKDGGWRGGGGGEGGGRGGGIQNQKQEPHTKMWGKNEAILRDWQHQKRSNSGKLPSKMESWVQSWRPRANLFCDFSTPSVYSTAPATKKWGRVIRVLHLRAKLSWQAWRSDAPKRNPLRKSAPWPPNISDEHVSCTAPAMRNASFQIRFECPTPAKAFETATKTPTFCSLLARYRIPCACYAKPRPNFQKWSETVTFQKCSEAGVLCAFWLGNVLHAKRAPNPSVFNTFDFELCFTPQRRAIFHLSSRQMAPHPPL